MHRLKPAEAEGLRLVLAGEVVPAPVEILAGAVRAGHPHHHRRVVRHGAEARFALGQSRVAGDPLGHVRTVDEHAGDRPGRVPHGLVDEIEEAPLRHAAGHAQDRHRCAMRRVGAAAGEHLVEQLEEALALDFRQSFPHGPTENVAVGDELAIGSVGEGEGVVGPVEHRDEARRLLEQPREALALGMHLPARPHRGGGLRAGAEHARDRAVLDPHRRVTEGEVGLLRVAVAMHREGDVIHMRGLARIGPRQDRPNLVPDVVPHLVEGLAQRARMASAAHRCVAVIVEGDVRLAPDDQHGLLRAEHHADQSLERRRPRLRAPERRRRPVDPSDQRAGLAAAVEEEGPVAHAVRLRHDGCRPPERGRDRRTGEGRGLGRAGRGKE